MVFCNNYDIMIFNIQRYVVQEITVNGIIEPGYYLPSLQRTLTEVENGIIINSTGYINVGFNKTTFPNFSGQGYAVLMVSNGAHFSLTLYNLFTVKSGTSNDACCQSYYIL